MLTMTTPPNDPPKTDQAQQLDEHWLALLARSGADSGWKEALPTAASAEFLSKLRPVRAGDGQGASEASQKSALLFAKLTQAGASKDEAAAEVQTQSLAQALSRRRVRLEAQVPKADEALFTKLQHRLSVSKG
jgi:MoxR-like ATPase